MLGNFEYCNPTKLYFGEQALDGLRKELPKYGKNVLLVYGGGSIKKNGIYDQVVSILQECGKTIVEDAGVMPNPTVEKLKEGCERARAGKVDSGSWRRFCLRLCESRFCFRALSGRPVGKVLYSGRRAGKQNHSGGLCADHGRNWFRNERRLGYHQP